MAERARVVERVTLDFGAVGEGVREQLSAAAFSNPRTLWLAADELYELAPGEARVCLSRLRLNDDGNFGDHTPIKLGDHLPLLVNSATSDEESEADIEGLDVDGGFLWFVGSHGRKRGNPRKGKTARDKMARLAEVGGDANRYLLGRLPLSEDGDRLLSKAEANTVGRSAARLSEQAEGGNALTQALAADPHLAPFLALPGKDNGFDIEGLVARDDRLLIGLRGPVLRGYAMLLDIEVERTASAVLGLRSLADGGRRYRKHFLGLHGLGVREACRWGEDVLLLAGPTMTLDGALRLFRLKDPWAWRGDTLFDEGRELEWLCDLPPPNRCDNAEGLARLPDRDAVLITYDSPCPSRKQGDGAVLADIVEIR